jgi:pimeloyl-ACP methyl ester carboxylesterase
LGIAETWDIKAVITHLQQSDFPEPFILMGESMGAMVAAVAAIFEPRVSASICIMPPAAPLVGMQTIPRALRSTLISAVNDFYAYDVRSADGKSFYPYNILLDGDLTFHDCSPAHRPRILYIMGDRDEFGWEITRKVWDHLYKGEAAVFNANRSEAPGQRKWFRLAPDFAHDLHKWDQLDFIIHDFLRHELT